MLTLKNFLFLLITIITVVEYVHCESDEVSPPKVTLPHGGAVVGSYLKTVNGKSIRAFRGIPYAEPPVGDLRFRVPVPAKPWPGEKFTNKDGNDCPAQNSYMRKFVVVGDEDCLYLNVYTPEIKPDQTPLSVMVYFHGGGWITGSGASWLYGPDRLLDHDVILVVGNYRLGALGFLSTGTEDCPGNNGLKDQTLLLRWVKDNIGTFGGNANDVTIFGESAGGGSVGFHMFSPQSKGLFHKAILQSGTNFNEWAIGDKAVVLERTLKVAEVANCSTSKDDWKSLIDCLRTKSAKDIASILREFFKYDIDPAVVFPAVIEPDLDGAFLTKHPRETNVALSGEVPIMIGITSEEGAMKSGPLINLLKEDFISKFEEAMPVLLFYDHKPENVQKELTKRIDDFYFKGKHDWSTDNHINLTNVFTDNWFVWGQDRFLRNRFASAEKRPVGPTYVYLFDHRGPMSISEWFHAGEEYYGVCHTDELPYLFNYKFPQVDGGDNDTKMMWALPYMWANFAKTGNPTPVGSEVPNWLATDKFPLTYAHIGRKTKEDWTLLTNEVGFLEDRAEFWRGLETFD